MKLPQYIFFAAIFLFLSIWVFAQNPTPTPVIEDDDEIIKINSRLIVVPVSVLDAAGNPVLGLAAKDFRLFEEGKLQEVAEVSEAEKVPLEIVIIFDVSSSTNAMFHFQQETAAQFLKSVMRDEDRATIFTVGEKAILISARENADKSAEVIKNIQPTKELTAFYDSVSLAANFLNTNSPIGRRKVVLMISDGEDTNSRGVVKAIWEVERKFVENKLNYEELRALRIKARDDSKLNEQNKVLKSLQNADTVFYSINPAGNSVKLNKMSAFGQSNLERFAGETGGTAFLPNFLPISTADVWENSYNTKRNAETLQQIFRQLANELRAQYLVQYYSDSEFPLNSYVKLKVNLKNRQNFRIRARQGYFVK